MKMRLLAPTLPTPVAAKDVTKIPASVPHAVTFFVCTFVTVYLTFPVPCNNWKARKDGFGMP